MTAMIDMWSIEQSFKSKGYSVICGVDEAGRGPLAGPVYAAAVVLPFGVDIPGLDDSKKVSESKRISLFDEIANKALTYGIAYASHNEIDSMNILNATFLAMNRAILKLMAKPDIALIDGNRAAGIDCCCECIVRGDGKSASIAAASILAKVSRDRHMCEMDKLYPNYGFSKHKGYGTKFHYEMLEANGICEIHRKTFLKNVMENHKSRGM